MKTPGSRLRSDAPVPVKPKNEKLDRIPPVNLPVGADGSRQ